MSAREPAGQACNAGADNPCPFTPGVGVSGASFSFDRGHTWQQPNYTGLTARDCLGEPGPADECEAHPGQIGTLPNYAEHDLVSDGDPALAFGPKPDDNGNFSYANGSRLYYANLTSALPGTAPFKGAEAIAVSHTDNVAAAAAGQNSAWSDPVIAAARSARCSRTGSRSGPTRVGLYPREPRAPRRGGANASSSPFFGNVYLCYAAFRGNGGGFTNQPLDVLTSRDGGERAGRSTRSRRPRTTSRAATASAGRAARCGPTRTAWSTSSTTSSASTRRRRPSGRSR